MNLLCHTLTNIFEISGTSFLAYLLSPKVVQKLCMIEVDLCMNCQV